MNCQEETREDFVALQFPEKQRYRAAALRARRMYPGPVGELINRELRDYADFGYRFDADGLLPRLMAAVMATDRTHTNDRPYLRPFSGCPEGCNLAIAARSRVWRR
jgi:hypothetical protein